MQKSEAQTRAAVASVFHPSPHDANFILSRFNHDRAAVVPVSSTVMARVFAAAGERPSSCDSAALSLSAAARHPRHHAVGIHQAGDGSSISPVLARPCLRQNHHAVQQPPSQASSRTTPSTEHNNDGRREEISVRTKIRPDWAASTGAFPTPMVAASSAADLASSAGAASAIAPIRHAAASIFCRRTDDVTVVSPVAATSFTPDHAVRPPKSTGADVHAAEQELSAVEVFLVYHRAFSLPISLWSAHPCPVLRIPAWTVQTWPLSVLLSIIAVLGGCCYVLRFVVPLQVKCSMDYTTAATPFLSQSRRPLVNRARFSPLCRPQPHILPVGASVLSLLFLSSSSALLSIGPVTVAASCSVTAPAYGTLGNCTTTLPSGSSCSAGCSVGYALAAAPQQTSCMDSTLTGQTCGVCEAGSVLTWDPTSLAKLLGTGAVSYAQEGVSMSLSSDGNTLAVGGSADGSFGATWVYIRNGSTWSQQGSKLVGTGAVGSSYQGYSVSLSSDGNTLAVGGCADNSGAGATWSGSIQGSCSTCPLWYFCSSGSGAVPTACPSGSYCPAGSTTNTTCLSGFYCPTASTQLPCPNGTYSALAGQTFSTSCLPCDVGTFCPAGSNANTTCAAGAYCPNPSTQLPCPSGTRSALLGQISVTSCTPCIAGRYGSLAAQTLSASCIACPSGSSCAGGANITACSLGQYCPANSSSFAACAAGQYCTNATITTDCPAGSWSNTTGLTAVSQCTPCLAGKYGSSSGQTSLANGCSFNCTAGTYGNTTGQMTANSACTTCPPGSYCTGGANIASCSAGTFSNSSNLTSATSCTKCVVGTFGNVTGQTTAAKACSSLCAAGSYGNTAGQTTFASA